MKGILDWLFEVEPSTEVLSVLRTGKKLRRHQVDLRRFYNLPSYRADVAAMFLRHPNLRELEPRDILKILQGRYFLRKLSVFDIAQMPAQYTRSLVKRMKYAEGIQDTQREIYIYFRATNYVVPTLEVTCYSPYYALYYVFSITPVLAYEFNEAYATLLTWGDTIHNVKTFMPEIIRRLYSGCDIYEVLSDVWAESLILAGEI